MTVLTVTAAKSRFLGILRRAHNLHEQYTLTHNGSPYAVIMSSEDYEGFMETAEILKNKALSRNLLRSLTNADRGKTLSFKQIVGRPQHR